MTGPAIAAGPDEGTGPLRALTGVGLEVESGEIFGFLGRTAPGSPRPSASCSTVSADGGPCRDLRVPPTRPHPSFVHEWGICPASCQPPGTTCSSPSGGVVTAGRQV